MEFHKKLYELRKKRGISQEELAYKLNVTRQTVSKWEMGESAPDLEKLRMLSDYFEISLDELVMGKESEKTNDQKESFLKSMEDKILTAPNKRKAIKILKIIGIVFLVLFIIDVLSMIVYFSIYGLPK